MRTQAEIENILVEIEKREQKATPGPLDRSGYCELDGAIHVGTIGPKGKTGINFTDLSSCDRLILDVTCLGNDDLEAIANAKFYAHARSDIPALVKLVRELMQQLDSLCRVGGTMANVMYNVKQRSPLVITEREREIIAALQQEWDLLSRSGVQEDKQ